MLREPLRGDFFKAAERREALTDSLIGLFFKFLVGFIIFALLARVGAGGHKAPSISEFFSRKL